MATSGNQMQALSAYSKLLNIKQVIESVKCIQLITFPKILSALFKYNFRGPRRVQMSSGTFPI